MPGEQRRLDVEFVAGRIQRHFLALVGHLNAGGDALGRQERRRMIAPGDEPDGGVVGAAAATVDHLAGGDVGLGGVGAVVIGVVAGGEALELLRRGGDVVIENAGCHLLVHRFEEGRTVDQPLLGGVLGERQEAHVDFRARFQEAGGVVHLLHGGLRLRHALVEAPPGDGRQAGADHVAVAGLLVADGHHRVVEHRILLRQDFENRALGALLLRVDQVRIIGANGGHVSFTPWACRSETAGGRPPAGDLPRPRRSPADPRRSRFRRAP